ncbi:MAG: glycosyltransferase [Flavisolibacter sp.]
MKKSLIILTPGFPSSEEDSTCLPMQQCFVKTLKQMHPQWEVTILSFHYPYRTGNYKWFDIEVNSFDGRNGGGWRGFLLRRKVLAFLEKLKKETEIIGMISFWYGACAQVGKKFADRFHIPHLCWILGQDAKKENRLPRKAALKGKELVALSDFLQNEFERNHGVRPAHIVPPGLCEDLSSSSDRSIDILAVGSLIPLKRYEIFLRVADELRKKIPNLNAVLAGEGPEKEKLLEMIHELGLQQHVRLRGELPHPEILQLMRSSKLFLHPSSYEGFSGVCLEALGAGTPVISFCRPMQKNIPRWVIVNNEHEMKEKAWEILQAGYIHEAVMVPDMKQTVKGMLEALGLV